ncbi:MAG: hypothetical protein K2K91_08925 [Ruminococcus sp.]|nr:hypothetical protein [Ruminococcus sp.]
MFKVDTVISLFELFSGQEIAKNEGFVILAMDEVEKYVKPAAFNADERVNFLCAAIANYRYQQAKAASNRTTYTYAGGMEKNADSDYTPLAFAESMMRDYFNMCSDIMIPKNFVFRGFSKESDLND